MAAQVLAIATSILGGIFKHHAAAVKTEAQALNEAIPEALTTFQNLVDAINSGAITPADVPQYLSATMAQYESIVYNQYGVKRKQGNGPDLVEGTLQAGANSIAAAVAAGGGTARVGEFYAHAGVNMIAPQTYTITLPVFSGQLSSINSDLGQLGTVSVANHAIPVLAIVLVGGAALFALMRRK